MHKFEVDDIAKKNLKYFFTKTLVCNKNYPSIKDKFRSSKFNILGLRGLNNFSKSNQKKSDEYNHIWSKKNIVQNFYHDHMSKKNLELTTYVIDKKTLRKAPQWSLNCLAIITYCSYLRKNARNIRSVLEIGSGTGINLIPLAVAFPEINFTGLELTKEGVDQANIALSNPDAVKNLCHFIYGDSIEYNGESIKNIEFIELDTTNLTPNIVNPDEIFSFLALEQMESVFDSFLVAFKKMKGCRFFLFEPFLEFNNFKQKQILKRKGYLSRSVLYLKNISDSSFKIYSLPRGINKMKYAFGIVKGKIV